MEVTRYLPLVGRILIGLPFLVSGLGKLAAFGPTTAYISSVGLPLAPLLLILGFRVREVVSGLAVFTLAAAIFFHHDFADRNQMIHFLKNIMIIGGLLQIAHFGAGRFSLDARRARDRKNVVGAAA
jgi:putative oxidoreductase